MQIDPSNLPARLCDANAHKAGSGSLAPVFNLLYGKYDTNGDGRIDAGEFKHICDVLGYELSHDEVELAMKTLDKDGSGTLSFADLHEWWTSSTRRHEVSFSEEQLEIRKRCADAFDYFDKDQSRRIEGKEIAAFYDYLVQHQVIQGITLQEMMETIDADNDGVIIFGEYIKFLERRGCIPRPGEHES